MPATAGAPFKWNPRATAEPMKGSGAVSAGDWTTVFLNWRKTNGSRLVHTPGYFLVHVIYSPNSDDVQQHTDYSATFGGSETNRRREYRINPGWCFQAPFDGQLSIIAGGDSAADVFIDVGIVKGFSPRLWHLQQNAIEAVKARAAEGDPEALLSLEGFGPIGVPRAERQYAPPVVGTPQLVPATWVDIQNGPPAIVFPDGAVSIAAVPPAGGATPRLTVTTLGGPFALDLPTSGVARQLGALAQGGFGTDGTPATWQANLALTTVDVWSALGG